MVTLAGINFTRYDDAGRSPVWVSAPFARNTIYRITTERSGGHRVDWNGAMVAIWTPDPEIGPIEFDSLEAAASAIAAVV